MNDGARPEPDGRVGEVIETSTAEFTTQCYRLYDSPLLGSLVRSGTEAAVFGVVSQIATRSMDSGRRPIPRGRGEDTEEEVYLNNPQISRLLVTEFRAEVIGHRSEGQLRRYAAPLPPRVHSFVYWCDQEEVREFSGSLEFIPTILGASITAADEVVASFLSQASRAHPEPDRFLLSAGRELAVLLSNQSQRLNNLLRRLSA